MLSELCNLNTPNSKPCREIFARSSNFCVKPRLCVKISPVLSRSVHGRVSPHSKAARTSANLNLGIRAYRDATDFFKHAVGQTPAANKNETHKTKELLC
jgi:hypothetical protein